MKEPRSHDNAAAVHGHAGEGDARPPEPWIDYGHLLPGIAAAIRADDCSAVFIVGDSGLGASSLLAQVGNVFGGDLAVVPIHGSPSLSAVPYGVLAPFLSHLSLADISSRVAVLRSLWDHLEGIRVGTGPALLLVDDAHYLDDATCAMLTELVQAGWAKIVAACVPRPGVPGPLLRLWHEGTAEWFDLEPLTAEQGHELCEALLGGIVLNSTSHGFWTEAGGNTLLLKTLVREAESSGTLVQRHGVWLKAAATPVHTVKLEAVVKLQLMRISAAGREALNLIALAEPVDETLITVVAGETAVQELVDQHLIKPGGNGLPTLRLVNPVYGEVLRSIVPAAQSLQLHRQLISRMDVLEDNPDSLLRMVTWSLDCGADVPDRLLIRAAVLSARLLQSESALRMATAVRDPQWQSIAEVVLARSYFNLGRRDEAATVLAQGTVDAGASNVVSDSLLRAVTRAAVGQSASLIRAEGEALREWGGQQPGLEGQRSPDAKAAVPLAVTVIGLLAGSVDGDYRRMGPELERVLLQTGTVDGSLPPLFKALALAMKSEMLCALGCGRQAKQLVLEAAALAQPQENDVFFVPEFISARLVICALAVGDWAEAQKLLDRYYETSGVSMASFGGAAYVVAGYIAIRQGKSSDALPLLTAGLEALRDSDPQNLFGLCAAMAFYTAAGAGLPEAERFQADYKGWGQHSTHLLAAQATSFFDAALELLNADGSGVEALQLNADNAAKENATYLELHALELALALGDASRLERFCETAAATEGEWAQALAEYGLALNFGGAARYLAAAEKLEAATIYHLAAKAYGLALGASDRGHTKELSAAARAGLARCNEELGHGREETPHDSMAPKLTRREWDIVNLAVQGLSDRQIADTLLISVRTVEGHLYRCYSKLGITGRDELAGAAAVAQGASGTN
ncbi:LuxR C-terminal-related transcriptional regulator [Arthrobacter sp. YA7-1]|uniref:LuxR C-terminal-related transcriptional regulator n=1 Tax=Arthrobacter sp. YA7-1 TaxID=2987701 RepID=UPI00222780B0|nr:LuxR C-terminal-related transcriptional regulator [Arthrobacter sp. YA7-1]UYY82617.1 LuxR C-terminal-related transcriptional regulator [Arthrobacter sp. YA7-1]